MARDSFTRVPQHHHQASKKSRRRRRSREVCDPASARQSSLLEKDGQPKRGQLPLVAVPRELFPDLAPTPSPHEQRHETHREASHHHNSEHTEQSRRPHSVEHRVASSQREGQSQTSTHHDSDHRRRRSSRSLRQTEDHREERGISESRDNLSPRESLEVIEKIWARARQPVSASRRELLSTRRDSIEDGARNKCFEKTDRHKRRLSSGSVSDGHKRSKRSRHSRASYRVDQEKHQDHQKKTSSVKLQSRDKVHLWPRSSGQKHDVDKSDSRHHSPVPDSSRVDREHEVSRFNRAGSIASDRSARIREQTWARLEQRSPSPQSTVIVAHVSKFEATSKHPNLARAAIAANNSPKRVHRSRSASTHSTDSRIFRSYQSVTVSPDMYNEYPPRDRKHSSSHQQYSRSPPHHLGQDHRRDYGRGSRSSHGSPSHSTLKGHHSPPPSNHGGVTSRGRGSGSSGPLGRGHFQNLSWTPDKGSRGGVAPRERKLPEARNNSMDATNTGSSDTDLLQASQELNKSQSESKFLKDEASDAPKTRDIQERPIPDGPRSSRPEARQSAGHDRGESAQMAPPTKPAIKFEMKVPTAPALAKRSNPIQVAPKAPSRPSVFQNPNVHDDRSRRLDPPSPRGKQPPSRSGGHRYDDYHSDSRYSRAEYHRLDRGPYQSDWRDPHPPPPTGRDRRPYDSRDVDMRPRGPPPPTRAPPKSLKSSKPRRKRFKTVLRKHVRVVLPLRALPKDWARSDFVYYPRPDRHSVVGAGTYGKVFKAHNVYLNHCVALKTLPLTKVRRKAPSRDHTLRDKKRKKQERWVKDGLHLTSLREIKLLKSISHQHENLVGIREIFLEGPSCNLVFDYFEFDMHGIIYSAQVALDHSMTKDLVRQVFQGLDFLHTKSHILHRDIKAANILVGSNGLVRITDFGLAKQVKPAAELDSQPWYKKKFEHSNRVITTPYRSPELLLGATLYGGEVDVWSAGCVLFEAFLKKLPFQGTGEDIDHLLTIWKILGLPNAASYPEVVDLEWYWLFMTRVQPKKSIFGRLYKNKVTPQLYHVLQCIFQHDPKKRPTAAQILRHPFFTSEAPLPQSAGPFLQTVDGEWHELEYKMIRDKEKAATRRKHENNVIIGYLKHKQSDHETKLLEAVLNSDIVAHQERVDFYKSEQESFKQRLVAKPIDEQDDTDHTKQVAEMKKTHGDMYMNAARRGRYRGTAREKVDEKLLQEAWKWYEDENKKGHNPVPAMTESKSTPSGKPVEQVKILSKGTEETLTTNTFMSRAERKHIYEAKMVEYCNQVARYEARKSNARKVEKRSAASPLVEARGSKKVRDDEA